MTDPRHIVRRSERVAVQGLTLIEMMVVLAIAGLMMTLGYRALQSVRSSDLREEANRVLAVLRMAYNGSSATGGHVRVVFDLDKQKFWMERCEGDARLRQADEEEELDKEELEELAEKVTRAQEQVRQSGMTSDQLGQVLQATSPEKAVEAAAAIEGMRLGTATCKPSGDPLLEDRNKREQVPIGVVRQDQGNRIRRIYVKHLLEPAEEGRVTVNFFPLGFAERAIVEIENADSEVFSLLVHATTGRVEIRSGEVEDADDFMMRNAVGDTEETREQ